MKYLVRRKKQIEAMLDQASKVIARDMYEYIRRHGGVTEAYAAWSAGLESRIDAVMRSLGEALQTGIENGTVDSWFLANDMNDAMVASMFKAAKITGEAIVAFQPVNLASLSAFLDRSDAGITLSQKIWAFEKIAKDQVEMYLGSGLATGRSAARMSRDVRQALREPDRLFRRVRDSEGNLVLSRAARLYHPGAGMYRSSYKNAIRMTATENNIAFREADYQRRQQMDFVTGVEIALSSAHPREDICDALAGIYPKGFQWWGWHPLCICYETSVVLNQDEFVRYMNTGGIRRSRMVTKIPERASRYIEENKERLMGLKNTPYWIRNNFDANMKLLDKVIPGGVTGSTIPPVGPVKEERERAKEVRKMSKEIDRRERIVNRMKEGSRKDTGIRRLREMAEERRSAIRGS